MSGNGPADGAGHRTGHRLPRRPPPTTPATPADRGRKELRMEPLGIEGAWVFTPRIHRDARGAFLEWFRGAELAQGLGHVMDVAQANCSVSRRGVIRGIHFADVPPGQAKYVTCVSGAILDAVVDL